MVWGKAGTKTLTTAGTTVTTPTMTPSKFNVTLGHTYGTGNVNTRLRVGIDSIDVTSKYSNRYADNGGSDDITETTANVIRVSSRDRDELNVVYGCNIAGEEKLFYGFTVNQENTGATSPTRTAFSAKWITTAGQYNLIQWLNSSADFPVGSNMTALGNEITPTTGKPTDVQVGSRFEETDTRKMYHYESELSLTGLKAHYDFSQTSGNLLNVATNSDSLGSSGDLTATGTITKTAGAWYFNGGSAQNTTNALPSTFTAFTMNMWIKPVSSTTSGYSMVLSAVDGNSNNFSTINGTGSGGKWQPTVGAYAGTESLIVTSGSQNTSDYQMVTLVFDGSLSGTARAKGYYNGVIDGTPTATPVSSATANSKICIAIQGNSGQTPIFIARYKDVSVWDRALTGSEITQLYNSGTPIAPKDILGWKELGT
jgi:hypothetical protein